MSPEEYYEKGEKLYSDFTSGAETFDPRFPNVPMFDEQGMYSKNYIEAANITKLQTQGNQTPRWGHYQKEFSKLSQNRPFNDLTASKIEHGYGKKPRYIKTEKGYEVKSPYAVEKDYREQTKNLDPNDLFARSDFDMKFFKDLKAMPTDTTNIETKVIDDMVKSDRPAWEQMEDPMERVRAMAKAGMFDK